MTTDLFPPPPLQGPPTPEGPGLLGAEPRDERPVRVAGRMVAGAIGLAVVAVLGVLVALWMRAGGLERDLRSAGARIEQLSTDLAEAGAAQGALALRIRDLEVKVGEQVDFVALARAVRPSVFTIETDGSLGSGFVVENAGGISVVVTNFHVIADAGQGGRVRVRQEGRRPAMGIVTAIDRRNDLAIVEVAADYPALRAAVRRPEPGDPVAVIGSPLGLAGTVTDGIVSGYRDGLLQFSAPVSPGNSGGPVVDRAGRVIGVAVLKIAAFGAEGLSFAVPIEQLCDRLLSC